MISLVLYQYYIFFGSFEHVIWWAQKWFESSTSQESYIEQIYHGMSKL